MGSYSIRVLLRWGEFQRFLAQMPLGARQVTVAQRADHVGGNRHLICDTPQKAGACAHTAFLWLL